MPTCATDPPNLLARSTTRPGAHLPDGPAWHAGGVTTRDPAADGDDGANDDRADDDAEFDEWGEELPPPRRKVEDEEAARKAWGSWRQDREKNRRKVLRALVGLVVISVLAGVFAYGCDALRGPRQLVLSERVGDFALQAPTSETEQLQGRLEAAGAAGPVAGRYAGPAGEVTIVAGIGDELPPELLSSLLPDVTGDELVYEERGGPITCGATATGSRCVWKSADIVAGTTAATPPADLERISRDLRVGAVRG
jgi:hypothetical protein